MKPVADSALLQLQVVCCLAETESGENDGRGTFWCWDSQLLFAFVWYQRYSAMVDIFLNWGWLRRSEQFFLGVSLGQPFVMTLDDGRDFSTNLLHIPSLAHHWAQHTQCVSTFFFYISPPSSSPFGALVMPRSSRWGNPSKWSKVPSAWLKIVYYNFVMLVLYIFEVATVYIQEQCLLTF